MQADPLKLRLNKLKKLSVQLKSKVLNEPRINYEILSEIISSVQPKKSLEQSFQNSQQSASPQASLARPKRFSNALTPQQARLSESSQVNSPTNSIFIVPPSNPNNSSAAPTITIKPILERGTWNEQSSSATSLPSRDPLDNQIEKLKFQNDQIETQIQALYDQLGSLHKKEQLIEQQSWKENLPYIDKEGTFGIFMTKLNVKEYDFDKIDYEQGRLELKNDKFIVQLPTKPLREYRLNYLNEVKYISDKSMRVDFKIDETMFIFIDFRDPQERNTWDRSLYINHQIAIDKRIEKNLFIESNDKQKQDTYIPHYSKTSKSKSSLRNAEYLQKEDLKKNDKSQFLANSSLKLSQTKVFSKSNLLKGSQSSSLRHQESQHHLLQGEYTLNGNNIEHNQYINLNSIQSTHSQPQEKQLDDIIVFTNIGDSNNGSRTNTSKFNTDINYQNQQFNIRIDTQPPPPLITPEKLLQRKQMYKWQTTIRELKEGYFFMKYAKDGLQPHNKKIYINQSQSELICMSSTDPNNKRVIPIENISKVRYPAVDEGIRKFLKTAFLQNFCVIEYSYHGTEKLMELGCQNIKFISRFSEQLRDFLKKKGVMIGD